jgi:hypothetical protein
MNNERMKILEMLKEGRITAEEADRLLEKLAKLDEPQADDVVVEGDDFEAAQHGGGIRGAVAEALRTAAAAGRSARATIRTVRERMPSKRGRGLLININTAKGDNVNVRIPLALVKAGVKLTALLPESAAEALEEKGVNLDAMAELDGDELMEALEELNISISTEEGDSITICCD